MFSIREKRKIAAEVQKILRATKHPELPPCEIRFRLRVEGGKDWSWATIQNNGAVSLTEGDLLEREAGQRHPS